MTGVELKRPGKRGVLARQRNRTKGVNGRVYRRRAGGKLLHQTRFSNIILRKGLVRMVRRGPIAAGVLNEIRAKQVEVHKLQLEAWKTVAAKGAIKGKWLSKGIAWLERKIAALSKPVVVKQLRAPVAAPAPAKAVGKGYGRFRSLTLIRDSSSKSVKNRYGGK